MTTNKILTQGVFDGFCLIYAVLNCVKALNAPGESAISFSKKMGAKWRKLIAVTPSLENMANGYGSSFGLTTSSGNAQVTKSVIENYLQALNEKSKDSSFQVTAINKESIDIVDFDQTVLLFCLRPKSKTGCYSDIDHWVCGVGEANKDLLIACSYVQHMKGCSYFETKDIETGRFWNNSMALNHAKGNHIYDDLLYAISKV